MVPSFARLREIVSYYGRGDDNHNEMEGGFSAYKSKLSFQYGFKVRLLTVVVLVCSPLMVATAKGSGNPATVRKGV